MLPREERVRAGLDAEEIEDLGETGRGRAPRGGGSHRGPKEAPKQERPARTPRQRSRTRRGQEVGQSADGAPTESVETEAVNSETATIKRVTSAANQAAEPVATTEAALVAERAPRKRSRSRKPAGTAGGGSVKLAPGSLAGPIESAREVQPAVSAESPIEQAVAEQAEPRKRTRTRKTAAAKVEVDGTAAGATTAEAAQSGGVEPEVTEPVAAEPRKRTRTRKPAAEAVATAEAGAGASDEDAAEPVANPRRTRVRASRSRKSAAAEPVVETPQAEQQQ